MNQWFGPLWNADNRQKIWQVGSEWSANLQDRVMNIQGDAARTLALYDRERKEKLSPDEYAWLAERGIVLHTEGEVSRIDPIEKREPKAAAAVPLAVETSQPS